MPPTAHRGQHGPDQGPEDDRRTSHEPTKETVSATGGEHSRTDQEVRELRGENGSRIVNNLDWTGPLLNLDFLEDTSATARGVNRMLARDVVARRLEDGIQLHPSSAMCCAIDFRLHELHRLYGCTLQTGARGPMGQYHREADYIRHDRRHRPWARDPLADQGRWHGSSARRRVAPCGWIPNSSPMPSRSSG